MSATVTVCILSHRAVLRVGGADRHVFLQGLISNDINLCTPRNSIYAALLTPQGKFLHDLFVYNRGDYFLIDCEAGRATELLQKLVGYRLRAKVSINDVGEDFAVISAQNSDNENPDPRISQLGSRFIIQIGELFNNFEFIDPSTYDLQRLTLGIPDGSRDMIVGKSTLAEGNFDFLNGISWTKGCYVGQELTARMHHRALVKKRLFPVKIFGSSPANGTIIRMDETEVGEMRSSNGDIGLALLNIEPTKQAILENAAFYVGTTKLQPYLPSWLNI